MSISALYDPHSKSVRKPVRDRGRLVRVVVPLAVMYNVSLVGNSLLFITLLYLLSRGLSQEALPIVIVALAVRLTSPEPASYWSKRVVKNSMGGFFALDMVYTSAANGCG